MNAQTQNLSAAARMPPSRRVGLDRLTIQNEKLRATQRRFAYPTVLLPTLGLAIAAVEVAAGLVGAMEVTLALAMYAVTMLGNTVGLHRHLTHRAFSAHPWVRAVLAVLGSMTAQGPVINWVANHRRHHGNSDQPGDPHSPYVNQGGPSGGWRGFWHAHFEWMFDGEITNAVLFAKDLLRDPVIVRINRQYLFWVTLGLVLPAVIGGWWAGSWFGAFQGFLWGGLVRVAMNQHAAWSISSFAHLFGSRPYDTGAHEQSRNLALLALPILGEGWHNNHHAFPNCAVVGFEWWQVDPSAWLIRLLERCGLVWDVKGVPPAELRRQKLRRPAGARA
ncbi:fatty acid desaturase [Aquabacterium sp. A7-Y]|uniref:acyl-CoA desaturase n=1 Tax=Aquabacterium sp. A7-Y TaxID=1349605 RepID=UPI00223E7C53|nr:fatty acid desaturase [Aquabacterium sp. A7-Y]MCW7539727.1 fatty acid desaturase [Aquabacterium sp. A7-Y]